MSVLRLEDPCKHKLARGALPRSNSGGLGDAASIRRIFMLIMDSEMFDYWASEPPVIPLVWREANLRSAAGIPAVAASVRQKPASKTVITASIGAAWLINETGRRQQTAAY